MLQEKIHIAVPTAFFDDESLHIQGTIRHIKALYQQGVKSVLVSGTTGEQHSLSLQEKLDILHSLEKEKELMHNMEIIFGVASVRQKEAEQLAESIYDTNIAGIMIGYPPYIIPTQEEAYLYTTKLIELSQKPTILYNNPGRTGFDLSAENIIELSKNELVVGVKDAGDQEKVKRIQTGIHRDDFYFYAGGEEDLAEKVGYGYDRLSSIAGNVAPMAIREWFNHLLEGGEKENEEIETMMAQVYQGNAIVNVKKIMNEKGLPLGICRSPIGNLE